MKLSILSYNAGLMRVRLAGRTVFEFAPFVEERASVLADALHRKSADLILLQEVYETSHVQALVKRLRKTYPFCIYTKSARSFQLSSGLVMISRYPIRRAMFHRFNRSPIDEAIFADKGFQLCYLDFGEGRLLCIANVHTTAGGIFNHPEASKIEKIRAEQIRQLLCTIDSTNADKAIIAGDLNTGPSMSATNFQQLEAAGFVDAVGEALGDSNIDSLVTWDPKNPLNSNGPHRSSPPQRIDHVLYRCASDAVRSLYAEVIFSTPELPTDAGKIVTVSDHYGLFVSIQIVDEIGA